MEETPEKDRSATFYIDLGINYQSAKQYEKSIECWNKTLALDPKSSTAHNNIGVSYVFMKKYSFFNTKYELRASNFFVHMF